MKIHAVYTVRLLSTMYNEITRKVIIHLPLFLSLLSSSFLVPTCVAEAHAFTRQREPDYSHISAHIRYPSHTCCTSIYWILLSHPFSSRHTGSLFPLELCVRKKIAIKVTVGCKQNYESFLHDASQGKGVCRERRTWNGMSV